MAISRMQQPRQMYGLGSFVKKLTRKVTKPFTKVARKIVPREIAGIMRIAAPFMGPVAGPLAYLAGTAKQTGRLSPVDLALASIPQLSKLNVDKAGIQKFLPKSLQGQDTLGETIKAINIPLTGGETTVGDVLLGDSGDPGIFGSYGDPVNIFDPDSPSFRETSTFQKLLGKKDSEDFDMIKTGAFGVGIFSLIKDAKTPQEAGEALVAQTGNSDDYERGVQLFSQLKPGMFDIPEAYRLPVQAANGGLMRTNYAIGSDDEGEPIKPDPTKPINPFGPKPTGPVLPDRKIASYGYDDAMGETFEEFLRLKKIGEIPADMEFDEYLDLLDIDIPLGKKQKDREGIMMVGGENNRVRELLLKEETEGLSEDEKEELRQLIKTISAQAPMSSDKKGIMMAKKGGRANLALGTKPTTEESGLGGLPIEADMRYTGGFMPYGAVEKADDVPARLSKNEFVFTADAVRAAGGGSVNEGAKKMYQAMKQLEKKPEAKGMMA